MNTTHTQTDNNTNTARTFTRHDLKELLPVVTRRVHSAEFGSQNEVARAYGVDKKTAVRWRKRAVDMGLTDSRAWRCGLLLGHMNRELAACPSP